MQILIVCGAGASSTFVAQRLRGAARDAGLPWQIAAGTEQSIRDAGADLILVGPHLHDRLSPIRAAAEAPVIALPGDVFADQDGSRTLALTRSALSVPPPSKGTP